MAYEIEDRRPGHVRQFEEHHNAPVFCECGARIVLRNNKFEHVGECTVKPTKDKGHE